MRVSRVLPVLAATAAVLVASAVAGDARPADGAAPGASGPGVTASAQAGKLPPMVVLRTARQQPIRLGADICDPWPHIGVPGEAIPLRIGRAEEPVEDNCRRVSLPTVPAFAGVPARQGPDLGPARTDWAGPTVVVSTQDGALPDILLCPTPDSVVIGLPLPTTSSAPNDCTTFKLTG